MERHVVLHGAAAQLPVDGVDAGGGDTDEDLAGAGDGVGNLFVVELGWGAVLTQHNSLHGVTSGSQMRAAWETAAGVASSR